MKTIQKYTHWLLCLMVIVAASSTAGCKDDPEPIASSPRLNQQDSIAAVEIYGALYGIDISSVWPKNPLVNNMPQEEYNAKMPHYYRISAMLNAGSSREPVIFRWELDIEANEYRIVEFIFESEGNATLSPSFGKLDRLKSFLFWPRDTDTPVVPPELFDCPITFMIINCAVGQWGGGNIIPPEIANIAPILNYLEIKHTGASERYILDMLSDMTACRPHGAVLSYNGFSGKVPDNLFNAPAVNLEGNHFTEMEWKYFYYPLPSGFCPPNLCDNELTGEIPQEILDCPKIWIYKNNFLYGNNFSNMP